MGSYLGALAITPLMALLFLGSGFVSPAKLIIILLELIVAPLVLSRILIRTGAAARMEGVKGPITNWSFFIVIYTMVGLNRNVFLDQPLSLIPVLVIAFVTTFLLAWVVERAGRKLHIERPTLTSIVLLATFKNYGLAGGLALVFFDDQTAVPATVTSVVSILYIIWLEVRNKRLAASTG